MLNSDNVGLKSYHSVVSEKVYINHFFQESANKWQEEL